MTIISMPFPPPLSACFNNVPGRGRVPSKRYKAWQTEALWEVRIQRVKPITGPVTIHVRLVAPDKRRRDAGNFDKATGDLLVKAGIIEDDGNHIVRSVTYEWVEQGPPCTVTIVPVVAS